MDSVLAAMMVWAVANTGYPDPGEPPVVEFKAAAYFSENVCPSTTYHCSPRGYYLDGSNTIILHEGYQQVQDDLRARALLLHEVVHYLQDRSGEFGDKTCASWVEREHQAYRLQLMYMVSEGANPFTHAMPPISSTLCQDKG